MFKRTLTGAILGLAASTQVYAKAPNVAVDIAPLHSLVAQVMDGVGEPALLIRPEASPHEYSLRPSEAKALSQADVVFWIGEGLTPWLEKPLTSLAGSATKIEMMEVYGTTLYAFREGATFEAHEHHEEHHDDKEHAHHSDDHTQDSHTKHDDHPDNHHDDHHEDDAHAEHNGEHAHHGHHHEGHDPHVWLDPKNAQVWLAAIADTLANADSEHAEIYQNNAKAAISNLELLIKDIDQQAYPLHGVKFIVFHDAYQYFEQRFDLSASGAISISDASDPSPARIEEIHQTVKNLKVTCVFTEPQFNPNLVNTVFENSTVNTIGTMDPLGANLETGKDQYTKLITAMIKSIAQCKP
ncbi:zinc transporter [Vibrio tubiashii]|uniref:High-affinity zinc uptake system protein ZnuA n=1 Tax=Vibrio tubiashii TaxID=29498 RepID=A0AAE5GQ81_9VIBR|nr:zinc ABC transporter substrate-binding protein [Vibrio tubiashii]NOI81029.1 zinc transporter [Vibrio tubiashii]